MKREMLVVFAGMVTGLLIIFLLSRISCAQEPGALEQVTVDVRLSCEGFAIEYGTMRSNPYIPNSVMDSLAFGYDTEIWGRVNFTDTISPAIDRTHAVSWVLILLENEDTAVYRPGILLTNRTVVNSMNGGLVRFPIMKHDYYVSLIQTNHIPLSFDGMFSAGAYNIFVPLDKPQFVFGGKKAVKSMPNGTWCAFAGNCITNFWNDLTDWIRIVNSNGQHNTLSNTFEMWGNVTNQTDADRQTANWFTHWFYQLKPLGSPDEQRDGIPIPCKILATNFRSEVVQGDLKIAFDIVVEGNFILGALEGWLNINPAYVTNPAMILADSLLPHTNIVYSNGLLQFVIASYAPDINHTVNPRGTKVCTIKISSNQYGDELKPVWNTNTGIARFNPSGQAELILNPILEIKQ